MQELLSILVAGQTLSTDQTAQAFERIMTGQASPMQVAALLSMMQLRGPSVEEITGAAQVMRAKVHAVKAPAGLTLIDTCGTGGDHGGTFNISTAAAIIAAGAGRKRNVAVAKHGNRSVTSKSGSSQVLETLGVKLKVADDTLTRCLDEAGICFCFAPAHHPAMKHAMPVRQELGIRTIFNILGPLTNPAAARRQVMGVFDPRMTEPIAQVLKNLGSQHAMIVHGQGLDEIVTWGTTRISHLSNGAVRTFDVSASDLGIKPPDVAAIRVDSPEQSAAMIREVLAGTASAARDIACLNAAAALVVADLAADLMDGLTQARTAIDDGSARAALDKLVAVTKADTTT